MVVTLAGLAIFLSSISALAGAQTSAANPQNDGQFWHENQIYLPLRERVDLVIFGVLRVGRNFSHPVDERGGLAIAFKPGKYLTIMPTWLYLAQQPTATRKNAEHRLILNATGKFTLGRFTFTDRNLIERRVRNSLRDFTMYRNRLQIDHPLRRNSTDLKIFVADEVWYDSLQRAWPRNRISAGIIKQFSVHFAGEFFYLRQTDGRARPGNLHVIGTLFRFYL